MTFPRRILFALSVLLGFSIVFCGLAPASNAMVIVPQIGVPSFVQFGDPGPKALGELKIILDQLTAGKISATRAHLLIRLWAMKYGVTANHKWNAIVQELLNACTQWNFSKGSPFAKHRQLITIVSDYFNKLSNSTKKPAVVKPKNPPSWGHSVLTYA